MQKQVEHLSRTEKLESKYRTLKQQVDLEKQITKASAHQITQIKDSLNQQKQKATSLQLSLEKQLKN